MSETSEVVSLVGLASRLEEKCSVGEEDSQVDKGVG